MAKAKPFATFLIIGPTCFFLGMLLCTLPYDYYVLWSTPSASAPLGAAPDAYFALQEAHLRFLHAAPPLVARVLNLVIGVGLLGFFIKLFKPSEANLLFDGASLALYVVGIMVYVTNIVKGLRTVSAGLWGVELVEGEAVASSVAGEGREAGLIGREDGLKVMAASNTILALMLIGVLVLQAGQWYAEMKQAEELVEMDRRERAGGAGSKKKV